MKSVFCDRINDCFTFLSGKEISITIKVKYLLNSTVSRMVSLRTFNVYCTWWILSSICCLNFVVTLQQTRLQLSPIYRDGFPLAHFGFKQCQEQINVMLKYDIYLEFTFNCDISIIILLLVTQMMECIVLTVILPIFLYAIVFDAHARVYACVVNILNNKHN